MRFDSVPHRRPHNNARFRQEQTWKSLHDVRTSKSVDADEDLSSRKVANIGGISPRWVQKMGTETIRHGYKNDGFPPILLPIDPSRRGHHSPHSWLRRAIKPFFLLCWYSNLVQRARKWFAWRRPRSTRLPIFVICVGRYRQRCAQPSAVRHYERFRSTRSGPPQPIFCSFKLTRV